MKTAPVTNQAPRLNISDDVVACLRASTQAGNSGAKVTMKQTNCPSCANVSLIASASLRSSAVTGYVMKRQFEVVAHCKALPCTFAGTTNGKFTV